MKKFVMFFVVCVTLAACGGGDKGESSVSSVSGGGNSGSNSNGNTSNDASDGSGGNSESNASSGSSSNRAVEAETHEMLPPMISGSSVTFQMGSPDTEPGRASGNTELQHSVTLTKNFSMAKYPVTQELYMEIMGSNPSAFQTDSPGNIAAKRPVEQVSWYDALVFCNRLSTKEGLTSVYSISGSTNPAVWGTVPDGYDLTWNGVTMVAGATGYRLPTEAEWEYACRAGKDTAFNDGTATPGTIAGYDAIVTLLGWYSSNAGSTTHAVGQKAANAWGLYDMHGNVNEWCWDWHHPNYYTDDAAESDPAGSATGYQGTRVTRGGGHYGNAQYHRSAYRSQGPPATRDNGTGFRLVRGAP